MNGLKRRTPLKVAAVPLGTKVTCLRRVEAYYSRYAGNPECWFEPGMVGVVGAIDVPFVRGRARSNPEPRTDTFCCVDFEVDGKEWRCSLDYHNIEIILGEA